MIDASGTTNYTYDTRDRLLTKATPFGTVSYTYDNAGNMLTLGSSEASGVAIASMTHGYDALNRLASVTDPFGTGGSLENTTYSYDAVGNLAGYAYPNDVNTAYTYDSLSRLLSVLHQAGTMTLDGDSYTYDNAGNRVSKSNSLNNTTENYSYDPLYQLTQVAQGLTTTESYTYDAVGNRLSSLGMNPYAYNSSNELTSTPSATFTYDANGNTLTKVDSSGTTTYGWDFENRLTSVALPGTGGTVTFRYDPFGRRIQKSSPSGTTNYIYDGSNSVEEVDQTGAELAHYSQGAGIDGPLAAARGGATGFYEQDGLGSVTSLTGSTGAVLNSYTYDAFGNVAASTGSFANPYQFTGRDYDAETGLRYYRARYYDPIVGRFLSEDPTDFADGVNLFRYARNNPPNYSDPTGLTSYQGFTAAQVVDLQAAVEQIKKKLKDCSNCAGGKRDRLLHALDGATFIYNPKLSDCGEVNPKDWFMRRIELGPHTFGGECYCYNGPDANSLASVMLHETVHLVNILPHEGQAYGMEKKCFGCEQPKKIKK